MFLFSVVRNTLKVKKYFTIAFDYIDVALSTFGVRSYFYFKKKSLPIKWIAI